jgi:ferrous-iron efflux pump FieF
MLFLVMTQQKQYRKNIFAAVVSIGTAFFLGITKATVGFWSGSLSILASALDSLLDAMVSVINFFTIRAASKPPDEDHRYGHGKFEAFAELFQGLLIGGSGVFLVVESAKRFFTPLEMEIGWAAFLVMIVSFCVTIVLVFFLRRTAKETGSVVIKADSEHYLADIFSSASVIGGLLIMHFTGLSVIDALLSLAISVLILHSSAELLYESYQILTDHALPIETRKKIESILSAAEKPVTGWHLLRTRRSGTQVHIDYHLVLSESISLRSAHDAVEKVEDAIRAAIPHAVVLTHMDPKDDSKKIKRI